MYRLYGRAVNNTSELTLFAALNESWDCSFDKHSVILNRFRKSIICFQLFVDSRIDCKVDLTKYLKLLNFQEVLTANVCIHRSCAVLLLVSERVAISIAPTFRQEGNGSIASVKITCSTVSVQPQGN